MHKRSESDPKVSLWNGVLRWKKQRKPAPIVIEEAGDPNDESRVVTDEVYFWAMPWV
jgi:hypothetical protein